MVMQKITFSRIIFQRGLHGANRKLDSLIRVNHAGELGADRIYAGQMAVLGVLKNGLFTILLSIVLNYLIIFNHFLILGNSSVGPKIKEMWEQEKVHRHKFEQLITQNRVRPSLLFPLWHCAGYVLGAGNYYKKK